jgi:hypothetical protein
MTLCTHFDDYNPNSNYTDNMMYGRSDYSLYITDDHHGGYDLGRDNDQYYDHDGTIEYPYDQHYDNDNPIKDPDYGDHDNTIKDPDDTDCDNTLKDPDAECNELSSDVGSSYHTDDETYLSDGSLGDEWDCSYKNNMKKRNRFTKSSLCQHDQSDEIRSEDINMELTILPKPSFMIRSTDDGNTRTLHDILPQEVAPDRPALTWKTIEDPVNIERDPWAFLEKPIQAKPRNVSSASNNQNRQHSSSFQNVDTNRLCKYKDECRMNRNGRCYMVHSLEEWKPRMCKFLVRCRRKQSCGYHHPDVPIKDYLQLMINKQDSIYAKNASLYSLYLS